MHVRQTKLFTVAARPPMTSRPSIFCQPGRFFSFRLLKERRQAQKDGKRDDKSEMSLTSFLN